MNANHDIRITPQARRWVGERGGEIVLRPSPRHGCCGGTAEVPVAEIGPPHRPEEYDTVEINDVRVHLAHSLSLSDPIELRLETLMGFGRLFVETASPARNNNQQESDDV